MKRHAYILFMALLAAAACSKTKVTEIPSITLSQKQFNVEAEDTSVTLTITSNCDWKAFQPSCVIVPSSGEAGTTEVTVSFGEAKTLSANTYVVDITSWDNEIEKYLVISQTGARSRLELDSREVTVEYDQTSVKCKVSSNCTWKAVVPEGVQSSIPMGEGDAEVVFAFAENITPAQKEYEISFEANGLNETFTIFHKEPSKLTYAGEEYSIRALKDGKVWMTENLRYLPEGYTPCKDLSNAAAGVYCPIVVNAGHTAGELTDDPAVIKTNGYLYQLEVAFGLKVGDITTQDEAKAVDGTRGICPEGWHIPTYDDYNDLIGYMNSATKSSAPYFDGGRKSVAKLNADGFNLRAFGTISVIDATKTAASITGWLKTYPDRITSGFFAGSTYADSIYWIDTEKTQIKNVQFWGSMVMENKDEASEYTYNGTKTSFRLGVAVRCVRDSK